MSKIKEQIGPFSEYDKLRSLSLVAGMLLDPNYHSNNFRIERLLHLIIAECSGQQLPSTKDIRRWLNDYEPIRSRRMLEDPPEDTFLAKVITRWGDFRMYGGLWESHAFFLQRILNIVQTMPDQIASSSFIKPLQALLKISEEIARRNKSRLNLIAPSLDKAAINPPTFTVLERLSKTLYFSDNDLKLMGCTIRDIEPFILSDLEHKNVRDHEHGLTELVTKPLVRDGNRVLVVLPTAIAWAIKLYVFSWLRSRKMIEKFHENLVLEYLRLLMSLPAYGKYINPGRNLVPPKKYDAYFLDFVALIDKNRYLHTLVVVDTLKDLNNGGINTPPKNFEEQSDEVDQRIKSVYQQVSNRLGFREGLSLVVMAGYGRARFLGINSPGDAWNVGAIGANDLETMAWIAGSNDKTIWKFVQHQRRLKELNIRIHNLNGILNLYGWWQESDHMLVPSSVDVGGGKQIGMMIPTDCIARVRRRAWTKVDSQSARYIDGSLKLIRRKNISPYFEEDNNSILYASVADAAQNKLVGCAVTKRRVWWVTVSEKRTLLESVGESNLLHFALSDLFKAISTWRPHMFGTGRSVFNII